MGTAKCRVEVLRGIPSPVVNQTVERFCNSLNKKKNGYSIVMVNPTHLNNFLNNTLARVNLKLKFIHLFYTCFTILIDFF